MYSKNIYWSNDKLEGEDYGSTTFPVSYVSGVDNIPNKFQNQMPGKRISKVSVPKPKFLPKKHTVNKHKIEKKSEIKELSLDDSKTASLKDLRPEDKNRIAELIKELARVGEGKEHADLLLQKERNYYNKQIQELTEQKNSIVEDKKELMQQYKECQQLLAQYQKRITVQQEKLAIDINNLITPVKKIPKSKGKSKLRDNKLILNTLSTENISSENEDKERSDGDCNSITVKPVDGDLDTPNLTELFEQSLSTLSPNKRSNVLEEKKRALMVEQQRLEHLLKQHELGLQRDVLSTDENYFSGYSRISQAETLPRINLSFNGDEKPVKLSQAVLHSVCKPQQYPSNPNSSPVLKVNTPISNKPANCAQILDFNTPDKTRGNLLETQGRRSLPLPQHSTESLRRATDSLASGLTLVKDTVSSSSQYQIESTIPLEEDECLSELLETLNNSHNTSVTLQKSFEDTKQHSLPLNDPEVLYQSSQLLQPYTTPFASAGIVSSMPPKDIDDSQLLEDIFFIH